MGRRVTVTHPVVRDGVVRLFQAYHSVRENIVSIYTSSFRMS
jgi:hypothetical protein